MFEHVNELAVFVAAILSVAVGSIWYSPLLFGKPWMRSAGLTVEDEELSTKEAMVVTVKGVLVQAVFFFVVAEFISVSQTALIPLTTLGVALATLLVSYMVSVVVWEGKSFTYLFIHAGYGTLALLGGIGVIAFWPW